MSKRRCPVRASISSSASVNKSKSSVASPASWRMLATYRLRGLCRVLPLPCAKMTSPRAFGGIVRLPSSHAPSTGICTSRTIAVWAGGAGLAFRPGLRSSRVRSSSERERARSSMTSLSVVAEKSSYQGLTA